MNAQPQSISPEDTQSALDLGGVTLAASVMDSECSEFARRWRGCGQSSTSQNQSRDLSRSNADSSPDQPSGSSSRNRDGVTCELQDANGTRIRGCNEEEWEAAGYPAAPSDSNGGSGQESYYVDGRECSAFAQNNGGCDTSSRQNTIEPGNNNPFSDQNYTPGEVVGDTLTGGKDMGDVLDPVTNPDVDNGVRNFKEGVRDLGGLAGRLKRWLDSHR